MFLVRPTVVCATAILCFLSTASGVEAQASASRYEGWGYSFTVPAGYRVIPNPHPHGISHSIVSESDPETELALITREYCTAGSEEVRLSRDAITLRWRVFAAREVPHELWRASHEFCEYLSVRRGHDTLLRALEDSLYQAEVECFSAFRCNLAPVGEVVEVVEGASPPDGTIGGRGIGFAFLTLLVLVVLGYGVYSARAH